MAQVDHQWNTTSDEPWELLACFSRLECVAACCRDCSSHGPDLILVTLLRSNLPLRVWVNYSLASVEFCAG